jgi:hypothetical protein
VAVADRGSLTALDELGRLVTTADRRAGDRPTERWNLYE